jgi:hypothetical protein
MRIVKRLAALLSAIPFCFPVLSSADEEFHLAQIQPEPYVTIETPEINATYDKGGTLRVTASGINVDSIEAVLTWSDPNGMQNMMSMMAHMDILDYTFQLEDICCSALLTVTGEVADASGIILSKSITRQILSPKQYYINCMIELAERNSKQERYRFAPAERDTDIGICKNFVMRLFDTFKADYRMLAYPELPMHMPLNNSKAACAPYDYGIEWRPETAEDGSPFEIVRQFKYNNDLSSDENAAIARELMHQVQKGDFLQMVGYYGGGNGPHSLFFIQDYDPDSDKLHWTDSNMRGKRINGERWGYMQFDAEATAEWYVKVFNMKKRGATLYRLREDLYRP